MGFKPRPLLVSIPLVERAYHSIARFYENCRKSRPGKKGYPRFNKHSRSFEKQFAPTSTVPKPSHCGRSKRSKAIAPDTIADRGDFASNERSQLWHGTGIELNSRLQTKGNAIWRPRSIPT